MPILGTITKTVSRLPPCSVVGNHVQNLVENVSRAIFDCLIKAHNGKRHQARVKRQGVLGHKDLVWDIELGVCLPLNLATCDVQRL